MNNDHCHIYKTNLHSRSKNLHNGQNLFKTTSKIRGEGKHLAKFFSAQTTTCHFWKQISCKLCVQELGDGQSAL